MKSCLTRISGAAYRSTDSPSPDLEGRLAELFHHLGLRPNEQKLLAALVVAGEDAGADELSRTTGIRHDEVYENLSNLGRRGLVSCVFSTHKRFSVSSLSDVVDQLISSELDMLTALKNKSGRYQEVVDEIKSQNSEPEQPECDERIRILIGRERVENRIMDMASRCDSSFGLVITEKAFRSIAHSALFPITDSLIARRISPRIVVPSRKIAACLNDRHGLIEIIIADRMAPDSASFIIADDTEILVIPNESKSKLYGISSSNQSFTASFRTYLDSLV